MQRYVRVIALLSCVPNSGWAELAYTITAPVPVSTSCSQDLVVTTTTDWLSAELLLSLTSGSIYQHPLGSTTRPNPLLFDTNPELAFDTFVWNGVSLSTPIDVAPIGIAGGAVDLGGNSTPTFNTSALDVTWYTTAGIDTGTFALARITLSNTAIGTWRIRITNEGGDLIATPRQTVFGGRLVAVAGDFDGDSDLDVADIDQLTGKVNEGTNDPQFDLNCDRQVDRNDRGVWVNELKRTYFGDANLDGEFNSGDFVAIFSVGEYEDAISGNSGWADGDWNGDGDFESGDFVAAFTQGGYEKGPRPAGAAVPEPSSMSLFGLSVMAVIRRRGNGRRYRTKCEP